jgi:hypothetical protein
VATASATSAELQKPLTYHDSDFVVVAYVHSLYVPLEVILTNPISITRKSPNIAYVQFYPPSFPPSNPIPIVYRLSKAALAITQTNLPTYRCSAEATFRLRTIRRSSQEFTKIHFRTLFFTRLGRFSGSSVEASPSQRSTPCTSRRTFPSQPRRIASSVSLIPHLNPSLLTIHLQFLHCWRAGRSKVVC